MYDHISPFSTLLDVAVAPPLISLLCCLMRLSKSIVAPIYVAPYVDWIKYKGDYQLKWLI